MSGRRRAALPADSHVHSEWSWDAPGGSMERTCERAVALGLPSVAFTEHADFTPRSLARGAAPSAWQEGLVSDGVLTPPEFDVAGYLDCLDRCRRRFPGLRVLSGVELGEPHRHGAQAAGTLRRTRFDRVLVSVHTLPATPGRATVDAVYGTTPAGQVVRAYLREVLTLVEVFDDFDALAHIDYAARFWPGDAGPHRVEDFKDDYLAVLTALAAKGRALEINTRVPLAVEILRWWHDVRGPAVTFASDAHRPEQVASGFADAVALAEAAGFAPTNLHDPWTRR